jgi:hypothetical protein
VDSETQFWWNWWVNFAVALGTTLAVLVALFGDWIKNKWFKPDLRIEFSEPRGVLVQSMELAPGQRVVDMRYYHLRVRNGTAVKRLRVSWDVQWDRGEMEMSRHLQIEELPDATT